MKKVGLMIFILVAISFVSAYDYDYEFMITQNHNNVVLKNNVLGAGWDGSSPVEVLVTIDSGILIGSTSALQPALDTGSFPPGSKIMLVNNGRIIGAGGAGGAAGKRSYGSYRVGSRGSRGGSAIKSQTSLAIKNNGLIAGGGGGGGGGGTVGLQSYKTVCGTGSMGGIGAGSSNVAGSKGVYFCSRFSHQNGAGTVYGGAGGAGGQFGQDGGKGEKGKACTYCSRCNVYKNGGTGYTSNAGAGGYSIEGCTDLLPLGVGAEIMGDYSDPSCISLPCGDGVLENPEECDDGNTDDGDGCSSICEIECVSTTEICDGLDNDCDGIVDEIVSLEGLAAYWKFDGDVLDSVGEDDSANFGAEFVSGVLGQALEFDNDYDFVEVDENRNFPYIVDNFSYSFWYYPEEKHQIDVESVNDSIGNTLEPGISGQTFVLFGTGADSFYPPQSCYFQGGTGKHHVGVGVSAGTNGVSVYEHSCDYVPALLVYDDSTHNKIDGWTYVTITYIDQVPNLYINGEFIKSGLKSQSSHTHAWFFKVGGSEPNPAYYGTSFKGIIDEVAVFNRPLNSTEISEFYNFGAGKSYLTSLCAVGDYYWANMNGDRIGNGTRGAELDDSVKLIAEGLNPGDNASFEIIENDNDIRVGDDAINVTVGADGVAVGVWKISSSDLDKASDLDEFYFRVNSDEDMESDYLNISEIPNDSPIELSVVSPECGEDFDLNGERVVEVLVKDEDDLVDGNVTVTKIVDGVTIFEDVIFSSLSNGINQVNYLFSEPGNIQIIASAWNLKGYRLRRISNVMIINEDFVKEYVAACILKPADMAQLVDSNVEFDASTTRALDYNSGSRVEINISSYPERLQFNWTFSEVVQGTSDYYFISGRGNETIPDTIFPGDPDGEKYYHFEFPFTHKVEDGMNWADLSVGLLAAE